MPLELLLADLVGDLEEVRDRQRRHDGGEEAGLPGGRHEPAREGGRHPLAKAVGADDQLADGVPKAGPTGRFLDLARPARPLVLGEWGPEDGGDLILGDQPGGLVGSEPNQGDVEGVGLGREVLPPAAQEQREARGVRPGQGCVGKQPMAWGLLGQSPLRLPHRPGREPARTTGYSGAPTGPGVGSSSPGTGSGSRTRATRAHSPAAAAAGVGETTPGRRRGFSIPSAEMRPPANIRAAPSPAASRNASREEVSIALPTVDRSERGSVCDSSPPARGRNFADETTCDPWPERCAPASWSSRVDAKCAETTAPRTAIAISPATRATALLTPDAIPALCSSTAFRTVVVSGATVAERPSPNMTSAGSTSVA